MTETISYQGMTIGKVEIPRYMPFKDFRKKISGTKTEYIALCVGGLWKEIRMDDCSIRRMASLLDDSNAMMVYSDYVDISRDGIKKPHPLIDYTAGSVRDDFDFGPVVLFSSFLSDAIFTELEDCDRTVRYGAFYAFRLAMWRIGSLLHVREFLYARQEPESHSGYEKQFDYVDPSNHAVQEEMSRICTVHLVYERARLWEVNGTAEECPSCHDVVASVVIPVKNRVKTVTDAVRSALSQKTDFPFNVLVVDNHSDDGTAEILSEMASMDSRLVHITPERDDLMIGGCWNRAVFDDRCGQYAVQLDSDDVYSGDDTLQKLVDKLRNESFAMVVGSYQLTDFDLNPIPPGVIDHREWTDENGFNNALRINGFGAPRAFNTDVLREIGGFPNVSYGEDYAVGLRITREYRLGRIYDVLYNCRRWSGNSDSALSQEKINRNNEYKDMLRTVEIYARKAMIDRERVIADIEGGDEYE